ncbi:MAG: TonB-dependent receptor [Ignavibacteriae bacterium]|nr:TonB-dependent receptor [Ignavibacteriota bacterium]
MTKTAIIFASLLLAYATLSRGEAQVTATERSFQFRDAELRGALDSLMRWYGVSVMYMDKDVSGKTVNAQCHECDFNAAFKNILDGQNLSWVVLGEQIMLEQKKESVTRYSALAGTVTDSLAGEWVVGASVMLSRLAADEPEAIYRWCSTNEFGFYSLQKIQPGTYILTVRSVGHRTKSEHIVVSQTSLHDHDVALVQQNVVMPEVMIEGRRSALAASEGISRGVYIRATPSDQNQYFLEGTRIYNPAHYGGVLSTFNGDALRDVQVIAGGVPPYYGGRIGGILDVTMRNGAREQFAGAATVGSLGSRLLLEAPLSEQTSMLVSGRRSYPDILIAREQPGGLRSDLNSTEVVAKVNHVLAGSSRLSLSGYVGRDSYSNLVQDNIRRQLDNSLRWGNAAASLRWIGIVSPSLFVHASVGLTRYDFNVEHRFSGPTHDVYRSTSLIEDIALRAHAEYFYDEFHTARAGVELIHHRMAGAISEFSSQIAPASLSGFSPWELSVYVQDQWRLLPSVSAELGARATSFVSTGGTFSAVDPRFSLIVSLDESWRLHSSLTTVNQFIHPYRNSGIFLFYPTIFFYPSTDKVRPSTSFHVSVGATKNFCDDGYTLTVESYYRSTQKLHEFVFDTTAMANLSDALLLGEGTTYGAELSLTKRTGDLTGSLRYSISWAKDRFAELNGGEPFRPRFDRRHELYASIMYSPHESWSFGVMSLISGNELRSFNSGNQLPSFSNPSGTGRIVGENQNKLYAEPYDVNGARLPGFQRLELSIRYKFSMWSLPWQLSLQMLSGYGVLDPFTWQLHASADERRQWSATLNAPELFPLYPVVSMGVRF